MHYKCIYDILQDPVLYPESQGESDTAKPSRSIMTGRGIIPVQRGHSIREVSIERGDNGTFVPTTRTV